MEIRVWTKSEKIKFVEIFFENQKLKMEILLNENMLKKRKK